MPVPWLQLIDAALGVANFARGRETAAARDQEPHTQQLEAGGRGGATPGGLEAQLAGVVVAALKEAFDRDTRRLDLEREQFAVERQRAERALQLERQRQAGDREIGRLRLLAGVAVAAWVATIATLAWSARPIGGSVAARVLLGFGWLFLLGAIAASFIAQSRAAAAVDALANGDDSRHGAIRSGASGAFALWLMIGGLVLAGLAALIA
jgi:hypothetical protein